MATGDSLSGDQVTIWIEAADTVGSTLTNDYQAEVTAFDVSGGETDSESIRVFGGGFIDRKKPRSQIEISMDVILRYGADVNQWDTLNDAGATPRMIAIQATDGTNYYWNAWNNVKTINFDKEFASEDEWKGTITFKLSPADADGNPNTAVGKANIATDLISADWALSTA
jgi:hypothetical protein